MSRSESLRGERNPMYGRTGELNPAFKTGRWVGIKPARRLRGDACEQCGRPRKETPVRGGRIEAHHRDGDRANNDPANIGTLCQSCHLKRHAAEGSGPYRKRTRRTYTCIDCGGECSRKAKRCRACARIAAKRRIAIQCEQCGVVFERQVCYVARGAEHSFCSVPCRAAFVAGRQIDLDDDAFAQLAPLDAGVVHASCQVVS